MQAVARLSMQAMTSVKGLSVSIKGKRRMPPKMVPRTPPALPFPDTLARRCAGPCMCTIPVYVCIPA